MKFNEPFHVYKRLAVLGMRSSSVKWITSIYNIKRVKSGSIVHLQLNNFFEFNQ